MVEKPQNETPPHWGPPLPQPDPGQPAEKPKPQKDDL